MYIHRNLSSLDASVSDKSWGLSGFGYLKRWYKCLEQATDIWTCVYGLLSPVRVIHVSSFIAPHFFCALSQILDIMCLWYCWFLRTEYCRMLVLCTGGRLVFFRAPGLSLSLTSLGSECWKKYRAASVLPAQCCKKCPKSARSAAALSVYIYTGMLPPSLCIIQPLPHTETIPVSRRGTCYSDLLNEHPGKGWCGFCLSFEHVCTSETETKVLWAWCYEPLLTEFSQPWVRPGYSRPCPLIQNSVSMRKLWFTLYIW